jgi:hypothetical protein
LKTGYILFHLNIYFSSIEEKDRLKVIKECYWPILELADNVDSPIAIELTGMTLEVINKLDPKWVQKFKKLLYLNKCELIGSGWSQLIGPLVPYEVNFYNQIIGLNYYKEILGITPKIALINEMVFSKSLIDIYYEVGYNCIIYEFNNFSNALNNKLRLTKNKLHKIKGIKHSIPVIWSDSVLFQKFQKVIHKEINIEEYITFIKESNLFEYGIIPIYSNDAEVFNFRPGRFTTESNLKHKTEWKDISSLINLFKIFLKIKLPIQILSDNVEFTVINNSTNIKHPILVKKQPKYNVNRWTVTGRNDVYINTLCFIIFENLIKNKTVILENWKKLCSFWSSDLRTHITLTKWNIYLQNINQYLIDNSLDFPKFNHNFDFINKKNLPKINDLVIKKEKQYIIIKSNLINIVLNTNKGLAIDSLSFRKHNFIPIIGTIHQGYFSNIEFDVDFFSGNFLLEDVTNRIRVTDLKNCNNITFFNDENTIYIKHEQSINDGIFQKIYSINLMKEELSIFYNFINIKRPIGIARMGILTFLNDNWDDINILVKNGGQDLEKFKINTNFNHYEPISHFVSSNNSFGATDGSILIGDTNKQIQITWDKKISAYIPMLSSKKIQNKRLTRLIFSGCELDDTLKDNELLMPFELKINTI